MKLKRRIEGRTDYRQRLNLLKSGKPRAVVRLSNRSVNVQIIGYNSIGDEVITGARSNHLEEYGWTGHGRNTPSAYLVGFLTGKKALKEGVDEAVLDIGLNEPHKGCRCFAALNGLVDAGVDIPHDPSILPQEDRVKGAHIGDETVQKFEEVKSKLEEL